LVKNHGGCLRVDSLEMMRGTVIQLYRQPYGLYGCNLRNLCNLCSFSRTSSFITFEISCNNLVSCNCSCACSDPSYTNCANCANCSRTSRRYTYTFVLHQYCGNGPIGYVSCNPRGLEDYRKVEGKVQNNLCRITRCFKGSCRNGGRREVTRVKLGGES